jgi:hypothetical protein
MLVTVPELDARKQHRSVTRPGRIPRQAIERPFKGAMIGDIGCVKAGARVPLSVSLGIESDATVVRGIGVTVKVNRNEIRIAEPKRGHRSHPYEQDAHYCDSSTCEDQRRPRQSGGYKPCSSARIVICPEAKKGYRGKGEGRPILGRGEERERIEYVGNRCDQVVRQRGSKSCRDS